MRDGRPFDYKIHRETDDRLWVQARTAEVSILQTPEGISIDVWPSESDPDGPAASLWLLWSDLDDTCGGEQ